MSPEQADMVGSHAAGSATYKPLIDQAVASLLAQSMSRERTVSHNQLPAPLRVCFVGVENRSAEELFDFKDQIYQLIDSQLVESAVIQPVSRHYITAALREMNLQPQDLFLPRHQRAVTEVLEQQGHPIDHVLFATITSGTTQDYTNYQRDYLLSLDMINLHTGHPAKATATLRKEYNRKRPSKMRFFKH